MKPPPKAPNCLKCTHFKVTWDAMYPRACLLFAVKCSDMPSHEIYRVNGAHCPAFKLKAGLK